MLIVKVIVVALLGLIVLSLGAGMFTLINDRGASNRTARFLTFRIALSIFVFLFIAFSFYMGWLQPHGVLPPSS